MVAQIADQLVERDLVVVALGNGEPYYENFFRSWAERRPNQVAVHSKYDNALAHKVEAGADMILMPSRYEPGGLRQIYSMKYGTVPVVRSTGGLEDTVEEWNAETGTGTGFKFFGYNAQDLMGAIDRALAAFHDKFGWRKLMHDGMAKNFGWAQSGAGVCRALRGSFAAEKLTARLRARFRFIIRYEEIGPGDVCDLPAGFAGGCSAIARSGCPGWRSGQRHDFECCNAEGCWTGGRRAICSPALGWCYPCCLPIQEQRPHAPAVGAQPLPAICLLRCSGFACCICLRAACGSHRSRFSAIPASLLLAGRLRAFWQSSSLRHRSAPRMRGVPVCFQT